ncbi:MAG: helix-turn-helix domain-containing protein [Anaerolineales bacterium]|nr:helix-turn-helix domain-containing protein [Anaerolineales bacterium]
MKQPDLGLKVSELRKEKGFTQEQLAEDCEVTPRTIQRIESGDVEPRAFTRNSLSNVLEFDLGKNDLENERFWIAALHLSSMFCIVLVPLLIWSWLKTRSYQVDKHGRQVMNFQITVTLALFTGALCLIVGLPAALIFMEQGAGNVALMSTLALISVLPMILIGFFITYQGAVNTLRVLSDKPTRYPLSIKFVK